MRLFVTIVLAALASCASPPMGLGTGARIPSTRPDDGAVTGSAGAAAGPGRLVTQIEAAGTLVVRRWFSLEVGAAFTRQTQAADDGHLMVATGGFPYLRPRLQIGPVSIATAFAGIGFGGGGGGFVGGIADLQVGYGTEAWSAYAGAYGNYFEIVSDNSTEVSASQLRLGGEYSTRVGGARVGVALELYRHHDSLHGDGLTTESRFFGAGLKLRVTSPVFH